MAEVIGTIAAAVQLAETARNLKRLQNDIKNAPKDVNELADEVGVLAGLLSDVQHLQDTGGGQVGSSSGWVKCCQLFSSSAHAMFQLVSELETTLQTHKRSGSFRVFLKANEMARCKERLERVKGLLTLTQQTYAMNVLTEQNLSILRAIHALTADAPTPTKDAVHHQLSCTPVDTLSTTTNHPSDYQRHDQQSRMKHGFRSDGSCQSHRVYNLGLPYWIVKKGIQILCYQTVGSWGIHFRMYNQLPPESELFDLAYDNKWEAVQALFVAGRATPFDVNSEGLTLLHVATWEHQPDACRMLLNHGLDPCHHGNTESMNGIECLAAMLIVLADWDLEKEALTKTISVLQEATRDSLPVLDDSSIFQSYATLPPEAMRALVLDQVRHEDVNDFCRAQWAMTIASPDAECIQAILGDKLTLQDAFVLVNRRSCQNNHSLLLQAASRNLATAYARGTSCRVDVAGWKEIIAQIIRFERTNTDTFYFHSSYAAFINAYIFQANLVDRKPHSYVYNGVWNQYVTRIGKIWLSVLVELGADLERYGYAEHKAIIFGSGHARLLARPLGKDACFQFKYLLHGASIDDWKVFVIDKPCILHWPLAQLCEAHESINAVGHEEYEMAGAFWTWIENPELFTIPGAYLDIDDSDADVVQMHNQAGDSRSSIIVTGPVL